MGAPQYSNAVGHLEAATAMNPALHPAHMQLGQILRDMNHFERAIARYKKVLFNKFVYLKTKWLEHLVYPKTSWNLHVHGDTF